MSRADVRPLVRERAWRADDLNWRAKAYLVRLTELTAEVDDETGRRRRGSKAMDARGHVSLRLAYLAEMLGTHAEAVKNAQQECIAKGYLSMVWRGRHGLPSQLQALPYRGDERVGHRSTFRPPYTQDSTTSPGAYRGDVSSPLSLETPDQGDHAPEPGGLEPAPIGTEAPRRKSQDGSTWHPFEASEPITSQRETA